MKGAKKWCRYHKLSIPQESSLEATAVPFGPIWPVILKICNGDLVSFLIEPERESRQGYAGLSLGFELPVSPKFQGFCVNGSYSEEQD